ncbi:Cysteine desulfurase [Lutibaculum baratangense AMV1]|uniref:Cysteine desulfurase n=1 Tax=Lutibaculum baratangense AMV1 TaxID=631454 RepID=V4R5R0_9HYPH|nr:Cysteine desulfurase [Lutibaculum baratangense AMV1]
MEIFKDELRRPDLAHELKRGLIGDGAVIEGPFGPKPLIYADYVASGRALRQIEAYILETVLPYYANSHTEASYCGAFCTRLREEARREIGRIAGAGAGTSVLFCGSGATAGLNRLVRLLDIERRTAAGEEVVILVGPYEHHSNILPWRESGGRVVEVPEADGGGPDLGQLEAVLRGSEGAALVVGAFSAASNVTGIVTDVDAATRCLKAHGALAVWDYAGGAPYLPMDMGAGGGAAKDAIVFSPHKFPGGPGASGIMVLRDDIVRRAQPTAPGGGSVTFVSPWAHEYSSKVSAREEAGTPNVVGDIRAALVLLVKEALGQRFLDTRNAELRARALRVWRRNERIELLGSPDAPSLPIFSFRVRDGQGGYIHHQLFTRMLSDRHGIQARGGCACAGPYAHRLLGIDETASAELLEAIRRGREIEKPGWARLNLSYLLDDTEADAIIECVDALARAAPDLATQYDLDVRTARFVCSRAA